VGAIIKIFELGYFSILWAARSMARVVFPRPVGRTAKVFLLTAVFKTVSWYVLNSIVLGCIKECSTNFIRIIVL
jgi:hypothetical protein